MLKAGIGVSSTVSMVEGSQIHRRVRPCAFMLRVALLEAMMVSLRSNISDRISKFILSVLFDQEKIITSSAYAIKYAMSSLMLKPIPGSSCEVQRSITALKRCIKSRSPCLIPFPAVIVSLKPPLILSLMLLLL